MPNKVAEVMSATPCTLDGDATVVEAARLMRDDDIGDVIVCRDGHIRGIVTDRDIVVRGIAEGRPPEQLRLKDICSDDITTVSPNTPIADAVRMMREKAVRRLPVVEGDRPVGVISIGDLAMERDPSSALADISAAAGNT